MTGTFSSINARRQYLFAPLFAAFLPLLFGLSEQENDNEQANEKIDKKQRQLLNMIWYMIFQANALLPFLFSLFCSQHNKSCHTSTFINGNQRPKRSYKDRNSHKRATHVLRMIKTSYERPSFLRI